jgi:hypothetical protein
MFAKRMCRSHFACIFSRIVSNSMNLGSRRFAIGLWRVKSVDAHSHMICVRLYAVMATDFDDARVIHSRRIHGDMAGCSACYHRIHGNHWKHVANRAAWQRGTLPGCLPGCPVHGPPMLCHMPSESTAAVDSVT